MLRLECLTVDSSSASFETSSMIICLATNQRWPTWQRRTGTFGLWSCYRMLGGHQTDTSSHKNLCDHMYPDVNGPVQKRMNTRRFPTPGGSGPADPHASVHEIPFAYRHHTTSQVFRILIANLCLQDSLQLRCRSD